MTKQEWQRVQKALMDINNKVVLNIDGYEVTVVLVRVSTMKNAIAIYVNGHFKGKWLIEDCDERRRFVQKRTKSLYTSKELIKIGIHKKEHKNYLKQKYQYYKTHWESFGGLRGHLIRNNESIELVEIAWE